MRTKTRLANQNVLISVTFLLIVPTLAHLLFSWRGFAPVDDGFTLAYSRRILEGEIPHRDFIIIRPFVSPLLHTPFVLFGGEYTFWVSRFFVWFQFACISWAWVSIINRAFDSPFNNTMKLFIALVSFAASVHYFVLTAWHTVDGLFLSSIGLWILLAQKHVRWRVIGYLLIAAAYLCKQSFLLMAPFSILLLGDWREKKYWITITLPAAGYCAYLSVTGKGCATATYQTPTEVRWSIDTGSNTGDFNSDRAVPGESRRGVFRRCWDGTRRSAVPRLEGHRAR